MNPKSYPLGQGHKPCLFFESYSITFYPLESHFKVSGVCQNSDCVFTTAEWIFPSRPKTFSVSQIILFRKIAFTSATRQGTYCLQKPVMPSHSANALSLLLYPCYFLIVDLEECFLSCSTEPNILGPPKSDLSYLLLHQL